MKGFDRQELWALEERAAYWRDAALNPSWKSAYQQLIDALDRMDATLARSTPHFCEREHVGADSSVGTTVAV